MYLKILFIIVCQTLSDIDWHLSLGNEKLWIFLSHIFHSSIKFLLKNIFEFENAL